MLQYVYIDKTVNLTFYPLFSLTRNKDSSGFEHVFVGESRDKEVIGFHNWIQFYLQEKLGNVDYQGYIRGRGVRGVSSTNFCHVFAICRVTLGA